MVSEYGIGKDLEGSCHGAEAGSAVRLTLGTGETAHLCLDSRSPWRESKPGPLLYIA
jgi:hypothetical protein